VANLDSQIAFYREVLGLQIRSQDPSSATLGAGKEILLSLTASPGAVRPRGTTGLYHFAVLLPTRKELARVLARLYSMHYRHYPTDHVLTETTYLSDPEGNGIEIYVDTPERGSWGIFGGTFGARTADGRLTSGRDPLDVEGLLRELEPGDRLEDGLPPDTRIGHIHLHVSRIDEALHFYHDVLGFDTMMVLAEAGAAFVSAGGYHHHIGLNTWLGEGAPPAPRGALGLDYYTVVVPEESDVARIHARLQEAGIQAHRSDDGLFTRDPSQNAVWLTSRPEAVPSDIP
jgi:catechol 2,3-dioxygenase